MPFLLFGSGLDTTAMRLGPLGGGFAQRVRWYDVQVPTVIDARAQLLDLFEAARRHGCFVILSSWEYQQSSSFAADPAWCDALMAIDPEDRAERQAVALADLVDFLAEHGLDDRIAFTEVHNEVQVGHLADGLAASDPGDVVVLLRPRLERAVAAFHARHPERPVTVNYARVPAGAMRGIPEEIDVLVTHPYVYGVLGAFIAEYGLRGTVADFDQAKAQRDVLLPDAPPVAQWRPDADWRLRATIVSLPGIYVHGRGGAEPGTGGPARRSCRCGRSTPTSGATPRRSPVVSTATTGPGSRRWPAPCGPGWTSRATGARNTASRSSSARAGSATRRATGA